MALKAAYVDPGTDSHLPVFGYRGYEHPSHSIVSVVKKTIAPEDFKTVYVDPGTDSHLPVSGHLKVFLVRMGGTLYHMRESERVSAWISISQAATAKSEPAMTEEISPQLPAGIEATITELVNLPQGWDGYDGLPVRPEVAKRARRFLAVVGEFTQLVPDVIPLSDGGLQLEWFVDTYEVEVVIAPDSKAHVYFECTNDGRIQEFALDDSFNIEMIAPYFRELCR